MEKQQKRESKGHNGEKAGRVFKMTGRTRRKAPQSGGPQVETITQKPQRSCHDCVFCIFAAGLWLRTLVSGFPVKGMCANQPDASGQLREIPGTPCRNFRAKVCRVEPPAPPNDLVCYIPLTRGLHAIVDAADYEWLSQYKWHATPPSRTGRVYAARDNGGAKMFMHRMIMQPPEGMVVDHINGNGLDNRRCNLRICTVQQNSRNRRKHVDGKSRFIGVAPKGKKWQAYVGHRHVGVFDDEVEAAKARDREALKQYGEHAWLNFPLENEDSDK